MSLENEYVPPTPGERHDAMIAAFGDTETKEEDRTGGTPEQIEEAEGVLRNVRNSTQWGDDEDFLTRVAAVTELAKTDWNAYQKGIDDLSSMFVHADKTLKAPAIERERIMQDTINFLDTEGANQEVIKGVRDLDTATQERVAEAYFMRTIGDTETPARGSLEKQYDVYRNLKGTAFGAKFSELESARLNKYGYGSFNL